jgi:hypothetical protein
VHVPRPTGFRSTRAPTALLALVGLLLLPGTAAARQVIDQPCRPPALDEDDNEARLLAFYSAPIAFSAGGMAQPLAPGAIRLSFEATYVPSPSTSIQQPEACYGLEKTENTELSPVFPRPRLAIGLPWRFVLEASYLPPITVADATPNLGSLALSHFIPLRVRPGAARIDLLLRAHGTFGKVRGPITCPDDALQQADFALACYGAEPSDDTFEPNMFGGEGAVRLTSDASRLGGIVGVGVNRLMPRFKVDFDYLDGVRDRTPIEIDLTRFAAFAGASYRVASRVELAAEVYSVPKDVTTFRLGAGYRLR